MTTASLSTAWTEQAPHQTALEALQRLRWSVFPLDEEKKPPKMGGVHPDGTPKRLRWKPLQSLGGDYRGDQWPYHSRF